MQYKTLGLCVSPQSNWRLLGLVCFSRSFRWTSVDSILAATGHTSWL